MSTVACGVDIGGTKILAGVIDEDGSVLDRVRIDSPAKSVSAIEDGIVNAVETLRKRHSIATVGIGAAGYVDKGGDEILFAPNLAWRHEHLGSEVAQRLGLPVRVDNDANAAAWAEYRLAAKNANGAADSGRTDDFLLVTVGTGIGGGIVVDGKLLRGAFGVGAEIGHMRLVPDGLQCGCGQRGCFEQYASGTALVRVMAVRRPGGPALSGPEITAEAQRGDVDAIAAFNEIGRWLGEAVASLAAILDPGVVVIGGGVAEAGDLLLEPAREAFQTHFSGRGYRPEPSLRLAQLGNDAGLIGAALLGQV